MPKTKKLSRFARNFAERVARGEKQTIVMRDLRPDMERPDVAASKLMARPEVRELVEKLSSDALAAAGITRVMIAKELGRIAFADPRRLLNADGTPKNITELDDDDAAAIAGVDVEDLFAGKGESREHVGSVRKFKLWNKREALSELATIAKMKRNDELPPPNIGPGLTVVIQQAIQVNGVQQASGPSLQRVTVDLPKPAEV